MKKVGRVLGVVAVAAVLAGVVIAIVSPAQERQRAGGRFRGADGPVPVRAEPARLADVPVYIDGVGTTKALNTVTVRPQVDGKLIRILFEEGQDVRRGDVLAEIDPTVYQAQLDQAIAKKAQDEAQLANARLDLERYIRLAQTNSATKQQADTQRALVAQLEALVQSDQAAIDNARAILGYTKIVAPIDGRTGIRLVDQGNIVRAADAVGLVVITQIRPISVLFNLPQQQLADVNRAFAERPLAVEVLASDNRTVIDRGTLQVVDNQVDQATGTVRLKAEFPNADLRLWPGQFVNVRLLLDMLREVVVVPTAAIQRGPNGTFVFVVKADDTVTVRPVTVALQNDVQAVVAAGLAVRERVVTTGFARLAEGTAVAVAAAEAPEAAPPAARPRGAGRPDGAPAREGRRGRGATSATQ